MYLGEIVESGFRADIFDKPLHPYTQILLSSNPDLSQDSFSSEDIPESLDLIQGTYKQTGCPFAEKCPSHLGAICEDIHPILTEVEENRFVACHLYGATKNDRKE